ncbi:hypothetical protein [Streptomyces niveus]|uniref:hypothetical protein n=1 Tax=Streptomyces niveus TaxID=193462 RepID=UPI003869A3D5
MAAEDRAAPAGRSQLRDLVRERRAILGLSYEKLAHRCVDESGERPVKSSWLHRLESGEKVLPPDYRQLQAMAAGLQVRMEVVQDAAGAQFFGIDVVRSGSGSARALVERADRMTEEQLQQLLRLLDSFAPPE